MNDVSNILKLSLSKFLKFIDDGMLWLMVYDVVVYHKKFNKGRIVASKSKNDSILCVIFDEYGEKIFQKKNVDVYFDNIEIPDNLKIEYLVWLKKNDQIYANYCENNRILDIKRIIGAKCITSLIHFTKCNNLISILKNGIMSRRHIQQFKLATSWTDSERLDGQMDAISLSVSFPNYKMFYIKRKAFKESEWVVLGVNPEVIYLKKCSFFQTNASAYVDFEYNFRSSSEMFSLMFADDVCYKEERISRSQLMIPSKYTTDPQAEILVYDVIEPQYIRGLCFNNYDNLEHWKKVLNKLKLDIEVYCYPKFFNQRIDHEYWVG